MEQQNAAQPVLRQYENVEFAQVTNETGQVERLHLDIYLPEDPAARQPGTIVWFHGGGFRPGNDKRQRYIICFCQIFAQAGYACVAPDYRVRENPQSDMPGTIADAVTDGRLAIEWVRQNSAQYGIDSSRMILAGGSAGGMLMTNLVHDPRQPVTAQRDGVLAVLDLWGSPAGNQRYFAQVNPGCPPTFIVHGTADQLVPYENSRNLVDELETAGIPVHLLTLEGAPHTPFMHIELIGTEIKQFLAQHGAD